MLLSSSDSEPEDSTQNSSLFTSDQSDSFQAHSTGDTMPPKVTPNPLNDLITEHNQLFAAIERILAPSKEPRGLSTSKATVRIDYIKSKWHEIRNQHVQIKQLSGPTPPADCD